MRQQTKSASVIALLAFTVGAAGLLWRSGCADTGWGSSVATYTRLCYSDVGPLYVVRGLADGIFPYLQAFNERYLEYPVLTGLWMWVTAWISEFTIHPLTSFVYLTWVGSLALLTASAYFISKLRPDRAQWFALSPAIFLTLGINWDAAAVLALILAMYFYRGGKISAAGVAIGVGAAFKLFPALLLLPILVDSIRHRKISHFPKLFAWSVGSWLVVNLPIYLLNQNGWWEFYRFSQSRPVDFGSFWLGLRYLVDIQFTTEAVNTYSSVAMVVVAALLLLLAKRIDFFTAAFVFIATFALVNKVYSPQFVLWLTPLAVIANVRLREFVIWQIAQIIYYIAIWRHLVFVLDPNAPGGINNEIYGLGIAIHIFSTLYLVGISLFRSVKSAGFSGRLTR